MSHAEKAQAETAPETAPGIQAAMRAVTDPSIQEEVTIVGLVYRVRALEQSNTRTARFVYWLVGILMLIGTGISGAAYSAHSQLADRLIEVTRLTEAQLARIEERMVAQEKLLEHVFKQRP